MSPLLVIPVENQVRELDAKLLLACAAAERGYTVVIGSRRFIDFWMPFLPRGTFLAKSMTPVGHKMLRLIHNLGHDVVAWDEETLVRYDAEDYSNWRFSPGGFAVLNHIFAWGPDDAELFAAYDGYSGAPIHITGNPRVDVLREELREYYREQADALNHQHGEFILINTNFAFVNNFVPALNLWQGQGRGENGDGISRTGRGMSVDFARGQAAHAQAIYAAFRDLVPQLSAWFAERTIVIRPHPSENHEVWREFERAHDNVRVLHEGSAIPWLMACSVLLHNGCTTAVEAAVLGRPTVAYQPVTAARHDYHLPNALSHCAATPQAVRDTIGRILAGELVLIDEAERQRLFGRHITAVQGELAVDRVMDVLSAPNFREHQPGRVGWLGYAATWLRCNLRTALKLGNMLRPSHRNSWRHYTHRFPALSAAELERRIQRFRVLLERFGDVRVTRIGRDVFRITSAPRDQQAAADRVS